jgi:hypothetical protein
LSSGKFLNLQSHFDCSCSTPRTNARSQPNANVDFHGLTFEQDADFSEMLNRQKQRKRVEEIRLGVHHGLSGGLDRFSG